MTDDQGRRLYAAAAAGARRAGAIVEIGSFRGRSTIVLAAAARRRRRGRGDRSARRQRPRARGDRRVRRRGRRPTAAAFRANLARGRRRATGCATCALFSADAHADGRRPDRRALHRRRPPLRARRGPTSATGARGWSTAATLLIHDSFSSIGVTLAIGRELAVRSALPLRRALAIAGRSYRADLAGGRRRPGCATPAASSPSSPWFARNVAAQGAAHGSARHGCCRRLGRPVPGVAVLSRPRDRSLWRPRPCSPAGAGRRRAAATLVERSDDVERSAPRARRGPRPRGGIARGLGRSLRRRGAERRRHGDRACTGPTPARSVARRRSRARSRSPAGVSLDELLRVIVPRGLVRAGHARAPASSPSAGPSPATSTARTTTSTARSATTSRALALLLADGERRRASAPTDGPSCSGRRSAGWASPASSCEATIRLLPIETSRMRRRHRPRRRPRRAARRRWTRATTGYRYSRGVDRPDGPRPPPRAQRADARRPRRRRRAVAASRPSTRWRTTRASWSTVPPLVPAPRRASTTPRSAAFNELWYRKAPRRRVGQIDDDRRLLPPARHGRLAGTGCTAGAGSCSTSSCVPFGAEDDAAHRGRAPRGVGHAELPRRAQALRRGEPGAASFPAPGWTLALDVPAAHAAAWRAAARARRARARRRWPPLPRQGRAHHARADPPRLPPPRRVAGGARPVDPTGVWVSDQARRLRPARRLHRRRSCMDNALGEPQTIVLLGGTSDIGRAIVARLVSPATRTVVLAGRDARRGGASTSSSGPGVTVDVVAFDAADTAAPRRLRRRPRRAPRRPRRRDHRVRHARRPGRAGRRPGRARPTLAHVNYTGAVSVSLGRRRPSSARQGHGRLVVLSSVAGERVRKAQLRVRLDEGRPRRLRPGPRRRPRRHRAPACSSCGPASCTRR